MDVADSLELLSPMFVNPVVRQYAVARLQQASDEVIIIVIIQHLFLRQISDHCGHSEVHCSIEYLHIIIKLMINILKCKI